MNDFTDLHFPASDGLRLHARLYGELEGVRWPVVCLPGLTRNARDFHELAVFLSSDSFAPRPVVAIDYRGRGGSEYDPDWRNYNLGVEATDVMACLDRLEIAQAAFVGTSRGGLITLLLAAARPSLLNAVVLNDVGPVLEPRGLARIRDYLQSSGNPATMAEAVAEQKAIHGQAFTGLAEHDWLKLAEALYRVENGRPVADFDPALRNVLADFDATRPVLTMWDQFDRLADVPLLVLRGENSALLAPGTLVEMARRHPSCEVLEVAGHGHPPMLGTAGLPEFIRKFIDRAEARAAAAR